MRDWVRQKKVHELFVSVITILELELGVAQVDRRATMQGSRLRSWLNEQVIGAFADRVLPVDLHVAQRAVAQRAAALHCPDPRPERDALIAATAKVHGLQVVTRNVKDFEPTGVDLVNPWEPR